MDKKLAIVTGVAGQDGSYLSEYLLELGYRVVGVKRPSMSGCSGNISVAMKHPDFSLVECDITDPHSVASLISATQPKEIYNLAAQSHVHKSFTNPHATFVVNADGVLNILEAIRQHCPTAKLYQASTSELFGDVVRLRQDEETPFNPVSPYGASKLCAHYAVQTYQKTYGLFACCGILFNHESPRRHISFVTRKITNYVARLIAGQSVGKLELGNLDVWRDWSDARDMVRGMHMMLQTDSPRNYILASGISSSLRYFLLRAFEPYKLNWEDHVVTNQAYVRPKDVSTLLGDPSRAKKELGWIPRISFEQMIHDMITADLDTLGVEHGICRP